jgi:hypothetical protein
LPAGCTVRCVSESPEPVALGELLPQPPKKRPRWLWPVLAAVVAAAAATGVTYALVSSRTTVPAAAASPSASPSQSSDAHLDERAACQLLVPAITDAITVMRDFRQQTDGSTVDRDQLGNTITTLQRIQSDGPADIQKNISYVIDPLMNLATALSGGGNRTVEQFGFTLVAQGYFDQCRPYTG